MRLRPKTRYIFIVGGVVSGVGKGIVTASLTKILQSKGYKTVPIKIECYVNIDAGTMNPTEHGEVFVLKDGTETDQDLGNYERFSNQDLDGDHFITTGQVYQAIIQKERNLCYGGKCVQVVPHIPDEVIRRIKKVAKKYSPDFILIEIGGTVGEYENLLFLEAARMMRLEHPQDVLFVLVSYLPTPKKIGEMKTKPTQHASRALNRAGLCADFIVARSEYPLDKIRRKKISIFCNLAEEDVISAPDVESIYEAPLNFEKDEFGKKILHKFKLKDKGDDLKSWLKLAKIIRKNHSNGLNIGIIGKYFNSGEFILSDSYISVIEAIKHASWRFGHNPRIHWLNSEEYEENYQKMKELKKFNGIIVPGGFGVRGVEGKLRAIKFCRQNQIPYLGLCLGMQLAVIEFIRNVCGLKKAHSTEIDPETKWPVIDIIPEQKLNLKKKQYGGSMRLGDYRCRLVKDTLVRRAYRRSETVERHRHRYELNNEFKQLLERKGLIVAGINPERELAEIIELKNHPFFVGTQFHPEFKSRPLRPHPLFKGFIKASLRHG